MTDPKKNEKKVFTTMEQLEAELFPNKNFALDEDLPDKKEAGEADILAKKLVNDLMHQVNRKEK